MSKPKREFFSQTLSEHLIHGRRPGSEVGEPWTDAEFAENVTTSRDGADYVSPRTISNWRKGKVVPTEIEPILRALFGPRYRDVDASQALRRAFIDARAETLEAARSDKAGPQWVIEGDEARIDRTLNLSDRQAALHPLQQQLQAAIRTAALALIEPAKRLANTRTWVRLSPAAYEFAAMLAADPRSLPEQLGTAYARLLELGGFLDSDVRIQRDPGALDAPLDPDIHRMLTHLVQMAAPWMRGFPTIAAFDDQAGKGLARPDLLQPAREFTRIAAATGLIPARDAAEMESLAETASGSGFQAQKAGRRSEGGAKNLLLTLTRAKAMRLAIKVIPSAASRPLLDRRIDRTLSDAEGSIDALAGRMPSDLGQAMRSIVEYETEAEIGPLGSDPADIPDDVQAKAEELILAGNIPPADWTPYIRELSFAFGPLVDLSPLSGLTALQNLDLRGTPVSNLSPLSTLTALQTLSLIETQVSDVSPLSGLTALQSLDLRDTPVSDISSLSGLTALQTLHLRGTQVSDVSPLSGQTALQNLSLWNTKVSDVSPLSRLTALQSFDLDGTQVSDVSPLSGLTVLQSLDLDGTQVSDVSSLCGLTALQTLSLRRTQVSDVSPLSGLTALQKLYIEDTRIMDVSALERLSKLMIVGGPSRSPRRTGTKPARRRR